MGQTRPRLHPGSYQDPMCDAVYVFDVHTVSRTNQGTRREHVSLGRQLVLSVHFLRSMICTEAQSIWPLYFSLACANLGWLTMLTVAKPINF